MELLWKNSDDKLAGLHCSNNNNSNSINMASVAASSSSRFSSQRSMLDTSDLSISSFRSHLSLRFNSYHSLFGDCCKAHDCTWTLQKAHNDHVSSIALWGSLLYTASASNEIVVWKMPEMLPLQKLEITAHGGAVKSLLAMGEGMIISGHQDKKIRVWRCSPKTLKHDLVASLPTMKNIFTNLFPPSNYVAVRRNKKCMWLQHADSISSLARSHNPDLLYSGSWDRTLKVWRMKDFKCLESIRAHEDAINAVVTFSKYVYTGSSDSKIKVWERGATLKKRESKRWHNFVSCLEGHKSSVNALGISPDGQILYSASTDCSIIVWEREDSAVHMSSLQTLVGHRMAVLCLAANMCFLCSGSADSSVLVWRKGSDNLHICVAVLDGHKSPVKSLCISPNSVEDGFLTVFSGSMDKSVKIWSISHSDL